MNELQATLEFSVELYKFHNIDLFQRGLYQVRCALRVSPKLPVQIEVNVPEPGRGLGAACLAGIGGACRPFQILYRNEEISLRDVILFRAHMLVDSRRLKESLERAEFSILLELWFAEQLPTGGDNMTGGQNGMTLVSARTLQLHFSPTKGLHYHLPVLFDYFHLSAISLTIHANLVALHQPYINTPRSAKPWLGTGKFTFRSPQPQFHSSLEAVFFGGPTSKCSGGMSASKLAHAKLLHQVVCGVLLESYEALGTTLQEYLSLLPQWQQTQLNQLGDITTRRKKILELAKHIDIDEDFTARANSDIAQLCAENIVQWQHFLAVVSCKAAVHQHLAKKHHTLRVKRFAEAFFVVDNPRHSAAGCYDANYQNYLAISELARRSRYLNLIPPLPVHCVALDGDANTIPIIFEDQYQDTVEFARRRSVAAGKKAGSDPILSAGISEPNLLSQEDCSCGISAILEARSNSRAGMSDAHDVPSVHRASIVQASFTITPNAVCLQTSTLPTRHSKSLDQLRINSNLVPNATLPRSILDSSHKHTKSKEPNAVIPADSVRQFGEYSRSSKDKYSSGGKVSKTESRDFSYNQYSQSLDKRKKDTKKKDKNNYSKNDYHLQQSVVATNEFYPRSTLNLTEHQTNSAVSEFHNLTLPRPILPPRNSYPPVSAKQSTASSAPSPAIVHSAPVRHIPRSNSTLVFPHAVVESDNLFQNNTLSHYRKNTKDLTKSTNALVDTYHSSRTFRSQSNGHHNTPHRTYNNPKVLPLTTENVMNASKSSLADVTYCRNERRKDSYQSNYMENKTSSRHRVYEKSKQLQANSSSSTDTDSLPPSSYKRLEGSASVPLQLANSGEALRHTRSAASVLDEMFGQSTASTSESLPNLAPPPPAFDSSPPSRLLPHSLSSYGGSTSSLTSEQSGWVSSHRSSEPSSPDIPARLSGVTTHCGAYLENTNAKNGLKNTEIQKFNTLTNGTEYKLNKTILNGEKLREKLQRLAAENNIKNSIIQSNYSGMQRQNSGSKKDKELNLGKSSVVENGRLNKDQKKSILVSDKDFILDIYKSCVLNVKSNNNVQSNSDTTTQSTTPISANSITDFNVFNKKDSPSRIADVIEDIKPDDFSLKAEDVVDHSYEELRLPPPQQFRDVPPPPEPFRDPPPAPPLPVDNLLYHVYESVRCRERKQNTTEMSKSQSTSKLTDNLGSIQHEEITHHRKLLVDEAEQAFVKARDDFKRQINFSGILYSEFSTYASTLPYFHISDEYRMFSPEGLHLIVCVHGLDGNSADLRLVKTYLELGLPGSHLEFLMSERNQGDTFSDFETMTDRLVSEILYQIESCNLNPTRISFVGHSLGNIIIRSALTRPQMKPLLSRLHTFLSLSGPHLGTLYNSSGLVNMGMWFMQKWKKSGSLLQLCLRDASDVRQTFLYKLSQRSTLHYFKNILLCGSSQDRYVPLHSARLELCKAAIRDTSTLGSAYREMIHNVVSPMLARRELTLVRYDVHHALPHTANALIGRAAHIAVLDSELFIEKFMVVAGLKYFR